MPRTHIDTAPRPAVPDLAGRGAKIVELNDQLRSNFRGGQVQMTDGIYGLDPCLRGRALQVMSRYNKFGEDCEHNEVALYSPGTRSNGALSMGIRMAPVFPPILPALQRQ